MGAIIKTLVFILFFAGSQSWAEMFPCELEALKKFGQHSQSKSGQLRITSIFELSSPLIKKSVLTYYKILEDCPSPKMARKTFMALKKMQIPGKHALSAIKHYMHADSYQMFRIGDNWDRKKLTPEDLGHSSVLEKAYKGLVVTGIKRMVDDGAGGKKPVVSSVGSGFYLGKFSGEHVFATARHVYKMNEKNWPMGKACKEFTHYFRSVKKEYKGKRLIGEWSSIDFALCALNVPNSEEKVLEAHALKFNFSKVKLRQKLLALGYGYYLNPHVGSPTWEMSDDCRILIGADFPKSHPQAWGVGIGCDASQGDSGSAVIDRKTGHVLGIMWGIEEIKAKHTSADLTRLSQKNDQLLWRELTMMVPASKIYETLQHENSQLIKELLKQQIKE